MKKFFRVISGIMACVVLLAIVFGAGLYIGSYEEEDGTAVTEENASDFDLKLPGEVEKRIVTREEVEVKLFALSEFATYMGEYTVSETVEQLRYLFEDVPILGTKNTLAVEASGIVKVGYDVYHITTRIDDESQTIYISLPEPGVLDNHIIWDSVVSVEKNNILNPIDFKQYQDLILELEKLGLEKAEADGIYQRAEEQLKVLIENFLSEFVEYEIVFM